MKLSDIALSCITTKAKSRLALEFDCSIYTVARWIKENEENGDLTKSAAVQIIKEETGLDETKILEEVEADA